jgi:hypothetical protein
MLTPYESQALNNHSQTLECLAERGGLDPVEIIAILDGCSYGWIMAEVRKKGELELTKWAIKELETRIEEFDNKKKL